MECHHEWNNDRLAGNEVDAMKVVLVEDNPTDQRLVQIALAEVASVEVELESVDNLAGLQTAVTDGFEPDVILLDLNLPDSTGLRTVKRVLEMVPRVPIIVLTGLSDEDLGVAAMKLGAQDFLVKGQLFGKMLTRSMYHAIERNRILLELQDTIAQLQPAP